MKQSRFERTVRIDDGVSVLEYRARQASQVLEHGMTVLDELSVDELAEISGASGPAREALHDLRTARFLSNGWQSWSPAWELERGEKMERARFIRGLRVYTDHPACIPARGEILSNFLGYIRKDDDYLALASVSEGTPPISFLFRRGQKRVAILAYAEGARFSEGELVARVDILHRHGYFDLKDALKQIYAPYKLFDRLAFLGKPGAPLIPGGYESWYNHYADINEDLILADLENLSGNDNLIDRCYIKKNKPTVFQVDDGWERGVGDWRTDEKRFSRGMAEIARRIEDAGFIPGIWLAPFLVTRFAPLFTEHPEWLLKDARGKSVVAGWNPGWGYTFYCLDLSRPEVMDYLYALFDRVVNEWGFRYLKLDFLYAGMLRGDRKNGGAAYVHYRRALERLTSIVERKDGKPTAFLGCGGPFEASFEHLPLMRIGTDTREEWDYKALKFLRHSGRPSAWINMKDTIGRSLWDRTVFLSDPDVVFCRERRMRLTESEKELVALVSRMFASQVMFSDDTADFDPDTEGVFTDRIAGLYDSLEGKEFDAKSVPGLKDVWIARSRAGDMAAVINLSGSEAAVPGVWPVDRAILARFSFDERGVVFHRHSISLFGSMTNL
jgi:alpha-galactosidase